jgi:hypothetical protein
MCADEDRNERFEEMMRSLAREIGSAAERFTHVDVDEIADAIGVDPDRAREWADTAGSWLRAQAENLGDQVAWRASARPNPDPLRPSPDPLRPSPADDPLSHAAPHPLDLPTEEQGVALAALDSGRWVVEPGSNTLAARGEGRRPSDSHGLVRELHARDWITGEGEVTLVGRHALSRWLDVTAPV